MKKIVLSIMALGVMANVAMAKEIKYQCLITEQRSLDSNISVKFSDKEMEKTLFTFKQNTETNVLLDPDGSIWNYKFTNDNIDYYTTKSKKNFYFLLGNDIGKLKNAGIYDSKNNSVFKGYCKVVK